MSSPLVVAPQQARKRGRDFPFHDRLRRKLRKWRAFLANRIRERILFPLSVRQLSGPDRQPCGPEEFVVVCLVRDGRSYLKEFLRHYRELSASGIVFLDNGSSDGTSEVLRDEPDVTVLRTTKPYKVYKDIMKRFLVRRFGQGNWVLCVDIDELFDHPFRGGRSLRDLLVYLNENRYTAVVAHLLDLFPKGTITGQVSPDWAVQHSFYDISDLRKVPYGQNLGRGNEAPAIPLSMIFGGIRSAKFQVEPLLTKHPLLFPSMGLSYDNAHLVTGARVADVSGVLRHYKYAGDFLNYARRIVDEGSFWRGSEEYKAYLQSLEVDQSLSLYTPSARELTSTERLLDEQFLVASDDFRKRFQPPAA